MTNQTDVLNGIEVMCLVWHSCKNSTPPAPNNHKYLLWDGESTFLAEYLYDRWFIDGQTVYMDNMRDAYYWADVFEETERFFYNKGGSLNG